MSRLEIEIQGAIYPADLHESAAPETVGRVRSILPLETTVRHVIWSGHALFIHEFGDERPDFSSLPREQPTVYPSRGDVLLYPGYDAPAEILIACGETCLNDPYGGEMAGNHFASMRTEQSTLEALDEELVETGSKPVEIRVA